jgi:hypothetical protein
MGPRWMLARRHSKSGWVYTFYRPSAALMRNQLQSETVRYSTHTDACILLTQFVSMIGAVVAIMMPRLRQSYIIAAVGSSSFLRRSSDS